MAEGVQSASRIDNRGLSGGKHDARRPDRCAYHSRTDNSIPIAPAAWSPDPATTGVPGLRPVSSAPRAETLPHT